MSVFAFGQATPPSESKIKYPQLAWNPLDDLEVRDRFSRQLRCLGISIRNTRCRWDTDQPTLRAREPEIETFLAKLSQKSPHDVTDDDLWKLLDLGVCGAHGSCEYSAKKKGLGDLQTRLAAARARTSKSPVPSDDSRRIAGLQNNLYFKSIEAEQHRTKVSKLELKLIEQEKQLQYSLTQAERDGKHSKALTEEVSQLNSDIKGSRDKVECLQKTCDEKDGEINELERDLRKAIKETELLRLSVDEKDAQLCQVKSEFEDQQSALKQVHADDLEKMSREYDALNESHQSVKSSYEALKEQHQLYTTQMEGLKDNLTAGEQERSALEKIIRDQKAAIDELKVIQAKKSKGWKALRCMFCF